MKIIHFYHFDSDPRFPPFLLYVRWKSWVTFVRRCFRDEIVAFYFIDCDPPCAEEETCSVDGKCWKDCVVPGSSGKNTAHYDNRPMQYTAIFHGCKNDNFQMKRHDMFLIFCSIHRLYSFNEYSQSLRRF